MPARSSEGAGGRGPAGPGIRAAPVEGRVEAAPHLGRVVQWRPAALPRPRPSVMQLPGGHCGQTVQVILLVSPLAG